MALLLPNPRSSAAWGRRSNRPSRPRTAVCGASKTTRGRRTTTSGTASGSSSSGGDSADATTSSSASSSTRAGLEPDRKGVQDRWQGVRQRLSSLVHYLTPKQEGDAGDLLMMSLSMAVFVYLAMQMYRMYYYVYLQMGVMDMMASP